MTPNLALMLGTIERALAASILPGAANGSAKEEASLAILFTAWLREVLDDVPAAERASYRECRAAIDDVRSRVEAGRSSREVIALLRETPLAALDAEAATAAEIREETRKIKALLGRVLRTLRAGENVSLANEVRARLYELAVREIDRERAFGRASRMDPDWETIPSLGEVVARPTRNQGDESMTQATPLEIVRSYNDDVWGKHRRELIVELLANPLRRHHPGQTQVFTHDDMLRRYDAYFSKYREMRAVGRHYVCEGEYVTLVWDIDMIGNDRSVTTISGIEIFRVVDGLITDVWNPNGVAEQYAPGPWPAFTR